ncbi:uncharacterized protein PV06_05210 [Exophiala oligosperma]|uniref:UBX domain-containing protein n=1 Tax=Exophiala oligosperma TaxID=215243 RepID=A0A0D2DNT3_9EURO|nr:uncharacterized protein PV06_05210 [Exophiala oligosperma]KIW44180.1 hypothetical protein PV06_05210 [Exophiala oligosperma]
MFHEGDLQSGIGLALQQSKAVLCFVQDQSEASRRWESILNGESIKTAITSQAVALRIEAGSQEAGFLSPICSIDSIPAIIVIKNAQLQENIQSGQISTDDLPTRLRKAFGVEETEQELALAEDTSQPDQASSGEETGYLDLQPVTEGTRISNNAYDALRNHTQKLLDDGKSPSEIFETQLHLINNIPIFRDEVKRLRGGGRRALSEHVRSRLLRFPAVGLRIPGQTRSSATATPSQPQESTQNNTSPQTSTGASNRSPPVQGIDAATPSNDQPSSERQRAQRSEYIKMQREREQHQRDERDRIKAQIKADREERRRLDELRKQGDIASSASESSSGSKQRSTQVRVQVRTFDGSTLRSTFQPTSTLSNDVRPWIDTETNISAPYNLKLILTPLPNRNIEAAEEEQELRNLGIVGSCTLVMVPVKGYVESYTGSSTGGLLSTAVSGGYNLVSGTAGAVFGGVKSLLGYNTTQQGSAEANATGGGQASTSTPQNAVRNVRVRTLADQRAESARRDQQFYNGNQLNFEPKKDDDKKD